MGPPGGEVFTSILDDLCDRSGVAVVLSDADGATLWVNSVAKRLFSGWFEVGRSFSEALNRHTVRETGGPEDAFGVGLGGGELRRAGPGAEGAVYRYVQVPLRGAPDGGRGGLAGRPGIAIHYLTDVSSEKRLKQHVIHNLQQLKIMKEIVDVLYESLGTQEVIYLILVAVTSQMGFGFNRAFFLNVKGNRLRGRIGIGPSNHEEAHQIWTRIASLNFSSLREVYNDLTRNGDVPDPRTQDIALRLDFELPIAAGGDPARPERTVSLADLASSPGLLGILQRGRPACLRASEAATPADHTLFQLLSTDVVAVVPLLVRGRLAGVIIADNFITRSQISEADLDVLKTFAGYAGVALERSHLYDELRDNVEKLQKANASLKANHEKMLQIEKLSAIGELAAYVSHEIRNPLVAIGGLARSLLKEDIRDPETAETLRIIVSEVDRLEKFLKDTLDFVKPREPRRTEVDLNKIVSDGAATFREELSKCGIELKLDLHPGDIRGFLDPDMLVHALSNLIKNAIEAMGQGGCLWLRTSVERGSGVISVGDTGPGIPEDVRAHIFDPFFTTKREGTGLGLSLALQHARRLGGGLTLEADGVYKTIFKMVLPLAESQVLEEVPVDLEVATSPGEPARNTR